MDKNNKFTKKYEGYSEDPYLDTEGNPTVGMGTNLNSPEVPELMNKAGLDYDRVLSGEQTVPPDKASLIHQHQLEEKRKMLQDLKSKKYPNYVGDKGKDNALESMAMNSPDLIGPNLQKSLNSNDTEGVIKEILLNSNKGDTPGLEKRRLGEAKEYGGQDFEGITERLSDNEKYQIRDIIKNIKNIEERNKVLQEFPFLNQIYNPRWGRIPQE